LTIFYF